MNKYFEQYLTLRNEVDNQCALLWEAHKSHMKCKQGCIDCCQSFRILPIEFHAIKESIPKASRENADITDINDCRFLADGACTIYEIRPIMCRTHGFPLV